MRRNTWFWGGLLLIAAALCLLTFNILDNLRAGGEADRALRALEDVLKASKEVPDYERNPNMEMPTVTIDGREYIGVLEIPALDRTLPVISRWGEEALRSAPCRYEGSAYLGNLILAGHNYRTHFAGIGDLEKGDDVYFTDAAGNRFSYTVSEVEELPGSAVEEMKEGDWDLTLFTCTLARISRITVRCARSAP